MGRLFLVCRLALKDIVRRPVQAVLLLLAITAGTATLTLGLALHDTTNNPYDRTRAATNGPDMVATAFTDGSNAPGPATTTKPGDTHQTAGSDRPVATTLAPLANAPGVVAHSGPFPIAWRALDMGQTTGSAEVEGRDPAYSSVDQPKIMQGSWVQPGGVVVEAGFASTLGLHVGDRLDLAGTTFRVVGTAVTAAIPAYPNTCAQAEGCILTNGLANTNPGLVWATQTDTMHLAGTFGPDAYYMNLKLEDPLTAREFAARYNTNTSPNAPFLLTWQQIRDGDAQTLAKVRLILIAGSWLLALLAVASVTILVGGRMVEQQRRVGFLKAVGGTPRFIAAVLLFEHALVGLFAAGLGLFVGWLAAPLIDSPGAGLLGAAGAASMTGATIASVLALALGVAIVATLITAIRAARQSTIAALNDSASPPRRTAAVIRLSAHLPAALLLGVRLAVRRPRRLILSVFSIAVTASGLVVLILRATIARWSLGPRVTEATTIISLMLITLASVNAVFIAWTTAIEARRSAGLARALGATPRQITTGLCAAQLFPAFVGVLVGIAGGIGFYGAAKDGGAKTLPGAQSLVATVVLTLLVVALLTAVPTRIGAFRSVAEVLQAETS